MKVFELTEPDYDLYTELLEESKNNNLMTALARVSIRNKVEPKKVFEAVVRFSKFNEAEKKGRHPTVPDAIYDPELSDPHVAGFTNIHGDQYYVRRSKLPDGHPNKLTGSI